MNTSEVENTSRAAPKRTAATARQFVVRIVLLLGLVLVLSHTATEFVFHKVMDASPDYEFLIETAMVVLITVPSVYWLAFWPLIRVVDERTAVEEALKRAHAALEFKVQARTRELQEANAALTSEVAQRREAETELTKLSSELERRVANRTAELEVANTVLRSEVARREQSEAEARHLNRFLRMLSACNQALVRERSETALLDVICDTIASTGGFPLVWVALKDYGECRVVAAAGPAAKEFERVRLQDDSTNPLIRAACEAIATRSVRVVGSVWESLGSGAPTAQKGASGSCVALPLPGEPDPLGALVICLGNAMAVDDDLIPLLQELAEDLAYGVTTLRTRTAHAQAVESLRRSEERFRTVFQTAGSVIVAVARDCRIVEWNPEAERVFGYTRAEALGLNCVDVFVPGRLRQAVRDQLEQVFSGADSHEFENTLRTRAGVDRVFLWNVTRFPDASGGGAALLAMGQDITERKRAQEALRRSEARLQLQMDRMPVACFVWANDFRVESWNPAAEAMFGFSASEMIGKDALTMIVPPETRAEVTVIRQRVRDGESLSLALRTNLTKDGRRILCSWTNVPLRDASGALVGAMSMVQDITESVAAEQQLRQQAALLDIAQDAIMVRDLEFRIQYWNKGAERLYGWKAGEAVGRIALDILYEKDSPPPVEAIQSALREKGEWRGELKQITRDRQPLIIDARLTLMRDAQGRATSVLFVNTDITERKRLEAQYLRAQRMECIGALASGIAHDLNNILAPILMAAPLLRMETDAGDRERTLTVIEASARRGADIVRQLLTFGRGAGEKFVPVSMRPLLRETVRLLQSTLPKTVAVKWSEMQGLWSVPANPTQLHQVVMNLCVNARDAMPGGGTLTLSIENIVIDETFASMNPEAKPGRYVLLRVADTGHGIPPAIIDKIFDPFFTTKDLGHGTGLGLSTVLGIVKNHGGFMSVSSAERVGTTFSVYLPAQAPQSDEELREPRVDTEFNGNGELILVVDDEEVIRLTLEQTLARHGYRTLTAQDGAEAIALYAVHRGAIALVLTDVVMPLVDGISLVRALRKISSDVKIIVSTGVGQDSKLNELRRYGVQKFLAKPYTVHDIITALHEELVAPFETMVGP